MNIVVLTKSFFKSFVKDESGQSMTEYALLLLFIVIAVKAAGKTLTEKIAKLLDTAFGQTDRAIQEAGP